MYARALSKVYSRRVGYQKKSSDLEFAEFVAIFIGDIYMRQQRCQQILMLLTLRNRAPVFLNNAGKKCIKPIV